VNGPYATAALTYRELGWYGVLPVSGKKVNLPDGYTGRNGGWPDESQIGIWAETRGSDNIVLRVPGDVLGIDVDAYDNRAGLQTIEWFEQRYGELPPTWTSTSRQDGSGIRLFRVPTGMHWMSDLGRHSDVQIVRTAHRYMVVWPSVHPDTSRVYEWFGPDGSRSDRPPKPDELAELPEAWVGALRRPGSGDAPADDGTAGTGAGGAGGTVTQIGPGPSYAQQDADVTDHEGNRVDPRAVLVDGLPVGEQETGLFSYLCSLRARGAHRDEMMVLGLAAVQRMANQPGREPWTTQDVAEKVDHVRREYAPGVQRKEEDLDPELAEWAKGIVARASGRDPGSYLSTGLGADPQQDAQAVDDNGGQEDQRGPGQSGTQAGERVQRATATDTGNALRFVRLLGDHARYAADESRWYTWDGRRWAPDSTDVALDLTKTVVDSIRAEALLADDSDDKKRWARWAHESESATRRRAMLALACTEPALVVTTDAFDADPNLLVVRNGTLDLTTGQLRESRQDDLCSRMADVVHDPAAQAPRWKDHVRFVVQNDPILGAYLRRALGYSLTGSIGDRAFFFLEGPGSNGKNALVEPVVHLLGDYGMVGTNALLTGGSEQHPTIIADLLGTRLVFIDELPHGRPINVERVKALTGAERLKARRMRQDFFSFPARFKLWMTGNGRPRLDDPSDGVWDRMHLVPCRGRVDDQRRIRDFGRLLYAEESSGILNWLLGGVKDWRQIGGVGKPDSVRAAVSEYSFEENHEAQFVAECVVVTGSGADVVTSADLYFRYTMWCAQAGIKGRDVLSKIGFGRAMSALGLQQTNIRVDGKMSRCYTSVSVNTHGS
jgi:putative DNA primase/helicase